MNEHEPNPERQPRHAKTTPSLEELSLATDDPEVLARWEEGLARWGNAFAAYTRLRQPQLHTPDVLVDFESIYLGSCPDMDTCIREELQDLDWEAALQRLRAAEGIPEDVLHWDLDAMAERIRDVYEVLIEGGEVHLFAK